MTSLQNYKLRNKLIVAYSIIAISEFGFTFSHCSNAILHWFLIGIQSVTLDGDKLVIVADGTDVVCLTTQLRKKLGYADLISVTSDDKKEENKDKEKKPQGETKTVQPLVYPYQYSYPYSNVYHEGAYDYPKFYNIF
jgi:hypothetical protein